MEMLNASDPFILSAQCPLRQAGPAHHVRIELEEAREPECADMAAAGFDLAGCTGNTVPFRFRHRGRQRRVVNP